MSVIGSDTPELPPYPFKMTFCHRLHVKIIGMTKFEYSPYPLQQIFFAYYIPVPYIATNPNTKHYKMNTVDATITEITAIYTSKERYRIHVKARAYGQDVNTVIFRDTLEEAEKVSVGDVIQT